VTSASGTGSQSGPAPVPARRDRADIQGLRAVAVLLVVLDHAFKIPRGGFVGVDVFFVISGFLITGILVREQGRTGGISLMGFYARRLRRIMPAAVLVAALTAVAGYAVWFRPRADQNLLDAIASTLWVSNWHFAATGTDYLASAGTPPALQHYWSLAVEEQFYVVWPWILLLAGSALATRLFGARARLWIVSAVVLLSFAWALVFTAAMPRIAYFDTIGLAWELGVGALAALVYTRIARLRGTRWLGITGLVLIVISAFLIDPSWPFPGPWAALPVLGAAAVLVAPAHGSELHLLTNRVMRWIGDISYSLYLWHFPVLIIGASVLGPLTWWQGALGILLSLGLAQLSYRFVEQPVRDSRWLRGWERPEHRRRNPLVAAGLVAVLLALVAVQFNPSRTGVLAEQAFATGRATATTSFGSLADVQTAVAQGLSATSYAGLAPSPDALGQHQLAATMDRSAPCNNDVRANPLGTCTYGSGARTILVIGDSVAMTWTPTVQAAAPDARVVVAGVASCAPWDVRHGVRYVDPGFEDACAAARTRLGAIVQKVRPDILVLSSAAGAYPLVEGGAPKPLWQEGVTRTVRDWGAYADRVVVLGHPPLGVDPKDCVNRVRSPHECISTIPSWERDEIAAVTAGALAGGATNVDVTPWFCDAQGRCPTIIGPYLSRTDTTHITAALAAALGPLLRPALEEKP
jgi:peptidoglycan/LPS O-acetylase OafA/YrhL